MRPLLFYQKFEDSQRTPHYQQHLQKILGVNVETYAFKEHREAYDHNNIPDYFPGTGKKMSSSCWCNIPDETDPIWPKLYMKPEPHLKETGIPTFVAKGSEILNLTTESVHNKFGKNITGPGDW